VSSILIIWIFFSLDESRIGFLYDNNRVSSIRKRQRYSVQLLDEDSNDCLQATQNRTGTETQRDLIVYIYDERGYQCENENNIMLCSRGGEQKGKRDASSVTQTAPDHNRKKEEVAKLNLMHPGSATKFKMGRWNVTISCS